MRISRAPRKRSTQREDELPRKLSLEWTVITHCQQHRPCRRHGRWLCRRAQNPRCGKARSPPARLGEPSAPVAPRWPARMRLGRASRPSTRKSRRPARTQSRRRCVCRMAGCVSTPGRRVPQARYLGSRPGPAPSAGPLGACCLAGRRPGGYRRVRHSRHYCTTLPSSVRPGEQLGRHRGVSRLTPISLTGGVLQMGPDSDSPPAPSDRTRIDTPGPERPSEFQSGPALAYCDVSPEPDAHWARPQNFPTIPAPTVHL